jgi:hypothetical protein
MNFYIKASEKFEQKAVKIPLAAGEGRGQAYSNLSHIKTKLEKRGMVDLFTIGNVDEYLENHYSRRIVSTRRRSRKTIGKSRRCGFGFVVAMEAEKMRLLLYSELAKNRRKTLNREAFENSLKKKKIAYRDAQACSRRVTILATLPWLLVVFLDGPVFGYQMPPFMAASDF